MPPMSPKLDPFARVRDPFALFARWIKQAQAQEPNDPDAAALATIGTGGMPNVRMVLVRETGPDGFVFYTNATSAKGRELRHPAAALCFHWKSARRQVRVRGRIKLCTAEQADAYFASRSRANRIGAWASRQSRPLDSRADLHAAARKWDAKFKDQPVPRPPYWKGFCLLAREIEFWQAGPARLHDRLLFRASPNGGPFRRTRLFP